MATTGVQFGRAASLIVSGPGGTGINLSELSSTSEGLRFKFEVNASDVETPNTAIIRVYNLSEETTRKVIGEYNAVALNAGYGFNSAQIFKGTIKQFRRGKERNVDSFLDILASDGDLAYNFAVINKSVQAGSTPQQQINQLASAFQSVVSGQQITVDPNAPFYLTEHSFPLPRGKVMFGLVRDYMRDLADTNQVRWSIQNGVVTLIPIAGYLPSEAVTMNSQTGMIGSPEATEQGIVVQCLLNPLIKVGTAIQLNNQDITTTTIKDQLFPGYTDLTFVAKVDSTAPDALYRVIVVEHRGDTRDSDWYSRLICLLIDQSSPAATSVSTYGGAS